jgi:hypothetical protein
VEPSWCQFSLQLEPRAQSEGFYHHVIRPLREKSSVSGYEICIMFLEFYLAYSVSKNLRKSQASNFDEMSYKLLAGEGQSVLEPVPLL